MSNFINHPPVGSEERCSLLDAQREIEALNMKPGQLTVRPFLDEVALYIRGKKGVYSCLISIDDAYDLSIMLDLAAGRASNFEDEQSA